MMLNFWKCWLFNFTNALWICLAQEYLNALLKSSNEHGVQTLYFQIRILKIKVTSLKIYWDVLISIQQSSQMAEQIQ